MKKKIYFYLAPTFVELPNKIVHNLSKEGYTITTNGLVAGSKKDYLKSKKLFNNVKYLDDLEKKFITSKYNLSKVKYFRKLFGDEALYRIIIADRHIGRGYVTGCEQFQSNLRKIVKKNNLLPIIYVIELLEFLLKEFKNIKPDLVFCYTIAAAPSLAMALVAKHLKIKFATFGPTRVYDRTSVDSSDNFLLDIISQKFKELKNKKIKIDNRAKKYLLDFRKKPMKYGSEYENEKKLYNSTKFINFFKNILRFIYHMCKSFFVEESLRKSYRNIFGRLRVALKIKYSNGIFDKINLNNKFVYYPLHVDPEASTMIMSPMHTDQISIIEAISKSIPFDSYLYVKEHVQMWGNRNSEFYDKIKRFPKVKLVHPREDNFTLMKSSFAIITITGTSGWEGMLLKKPVIFLSNTPFLVIKDGYELCNDLSKLPKVFKKIDKFKFCSDQKILRYLTILFQNSFPLPEKSFWAVKNKPNLINKNIKTFQIIANEFKKILN